MKGTQATHASVRDASQDRAEVQRQLKQLDAVLVSHYYTPDAVQALTEESGGFIGDSLAMADFGRRHKSQTLIVCGVKFMGETAKILSPEKTVLMPSLLATCSLDISCPSEAFARFCQQHPERTVVVYANTSARVKAIADWVVTSSNAVAIIEQLHAQGQSIVWASDRYLGQYIQQQTGADMLLWHGSCIVHEEFKAKGLQQLRLHYPDAAILVHPESPPAVIEMADVVGSTSVLLKASQALPNEQIIVATDQGILYKMRQLSPHKTFIAAPTAGNGATCRSCAYCPWMAMNQLSTLLQHHHQQITIILVLRKLVSVCGIYLTHPHAGTCM